MVRPLGEYLKEWRRREGLSLEDLSQQTGVSVDVLRRLEAGHVEGPAEGSFGEYLRACRQDRGWSLEVVARQTRIPLRYLEALEADDLDQIPVPAVIVKAYVKSYARCVALTPVQEIEILRRLEPSTVPTTARQPAAADAEPSGIFMQGKQVAQDLYARVGVWLLITVMNIRLRWERIERKAQLLVRAGVWAALGRAADARRASSTAICAAWSRTRADFRHAGSALTGHLARLSRAGYQLGTRAGKAMRDLGQRAATDMSVWADRARPFAMRTLTATQARGSSLWSKRTDLAAALSAASRRALSGIAAAFAVMVTPNLPGSVHLSPVYGDLGRPWVPSRDRAVKLPASCPDPTRQGKVPVTDRLSRVREGSEIMKGWGWTVQHILAIVIALGLAVILGHVPLFKSTGLVGTTLTAARIAECLGYGGAVALFWSLGRRIAARMPVSTTWWWLARRTIMPLVTFLVVFAAYYVVLLAAEPFLSKAGRLIYDWTFIVAIMVAALWLTLAAFSSQSPAAVAEGGDPDQPDDLLVCARCHETMAEGMAYCGRCGAPLV